MEYKKRFQMSTITSLFFFRCTKYSINDVLFGLNVMSYIQNIVMTKDVKNASTIRFSLRC